MLFRSLGNAEVISEEQTEEVPVIVEEQEEEVSENVVEEKTAEENEDVVLEEVPIEEPEEPKMELDQDAEAAMAAFEASLLNGLGGFAEATEEVIQPEEVPEPEEEVTIPEEASEAEEEITIPEEELLMPEEIIDTMAEEANVIEDIQEPTEEDDDIKIAPPIGRHEENNLEEQLLAALEGQPETILQDEKEEDENAIPEIGRAHV